MPPVRVPRDQGFSLLECLVASTLLAVGVLSLSQLFAAATSLNISSRHATLAAIVAAQKLEELRALTAHAPGTDFLDARGLLLASGGTPPRGTMYVRRWTVDPLHTAPANAVVLQVTVATGPAGSITRREVRLMSVRARKSP